jgi:hypothetical protein
MQDGDDRESFSPGWSPATCDRDGSCRALVGLISVSGGALGGGVESAEMRVVRDSKP